MPKTAGALYWEELQKVLETAVITETSHIADAADLVVTALAAGGRLYVYDTGHMLQRELVNRAGGLVAMTPLSFGLELDHAIAHEPPRDRPTPTEEEIRGWVRYALGQAGVVEGDAAIVASVTGARVLPVEVALELKARGVRLIGLTSRAYSAFVPVRHSSGKKLIELCDVVIDNPCRVGDAAVEMPGFPVRVGPTTGLSAALLMWMLCTEVVSRQLQRGERPYVLESMNLPGANERNRDRALAYLRTIGAGE